MEKGTLYELRAIRNRCKNQMKKGVCKGCPFFIEDSGDMVCLFGDTPDDWKLEEMTTRTEKIIKKVLGGEQNV